MVSLYVDDVLHSYGLHALMVKGLSWFTVDAYIYYIFCFKLNDGSTKIAKKK